MKYLFIILTISACNPSRNLENFPPLESFKAYYVHDLGGRCKCSKCAAARIDTIPSKILLSHDAPAFGHSIDGYCICKGGQCTGRHLRYWHRRWIVIGPEYTVWGCKRRGSK
jgi:hypothetical protein